MSNESQRQRTRERRKRTNKTASTPIPINRRQLTVLALTAVVAGVIALVKPLRTQLIASLKAMSTSLQPELVAIVIVVIIAIYLIAWQHCLAKKRPDRLRSRDAVVGLTIGIQISTAHAHRMASKTLHRFDVPLEHPD